MKNQKSVRILIMHNNDFPSTGGDHLDEPPLAEDYILGIAARAQVKNVAAKIRECLYSCGYSNVSIYPVEDLSQVEEVAQRDDVDVVFNLCESLDGDPWMEIEIIKILEKGQARFTGNSSIPLANCLDKFHCSTLLRKAKVQAPESYKIRSVEDLKRFKPFFKNHSQWMIKPNSEDGSTGIDFSSVVSTEEALDQKVLEMLSGSERSLIIQQYIEGREINLALLFSDTKLWTFSEIDFSGLNKSCPRILNYASKWQEDSHEYNFTPSIKACVDNDLQKKMIDMAQKAAQILGINAYARFDFRISEEGQPYIIDINPNCDLDYDAGFSRSFRLRDVSYETVISSVLTKAHKPSHFVESLVSPLRSKLSDERFNTVMASPEF